MNILICEDNERKFESIKETILEKYPNASIDWVKFAKASIISTREKEYDFLIQDMQLPINSDSGIDLEGGLYVLHRLEYEEQKPIKVCICSSDDKYGYILKEKGFDTPFIHFQGYDFKKKLYDFLEN